mmetsp:Transcript_70080/g.123881  ORF Transcript_70080/g.123881 Transcript_70080/m.123881 type:complete len:245 (+) Transcript_70080:43-777(+)
MESDTSPPPQPQAIWASKIVGLAVGPGSISVVPIIVREPSVFNFKMRSDAHLEICLSNAATAQILHEGVRFRQLGNREFRCIGAFETDAEIVNITFENRSSGRRAVVDGQVRIEPIHAVRSYDEKQRRIVLRSAIESRRKLLQTHQAAASECAAKAHELRTTLLELQQAVEIAKQGVAENELSLARHCEESVFLSEEISSLELQHRRLCAADENGIPNGQLREESTRCTETRRDTDAVLTLRNS